MQFITILLTVVSVASLVAGQDISLENVKEAFQAAHIPTNINLPFDPQVLFQVAFPEPSGEPVYLHAGIHLSQSAVAGPPTFSIRSRTIAYGGPFVVAAIDPDIPTPQNPTEAQYRHFLGGDLGLDAFGRDAEILVNSTAAISNFVQPTPPAGSAPHRYIFLLFTQPSDFKTQQIITPSTQRSHFNLSAFVADVGLGAPLGGTFMLVGPEPSSTQL